MIIALLGWKGSGKTYLAKHLEANYGFKHLAFADPLKKIISDLFNIDRKILDGETEETRILKELPLKKLSEIFGREITPRNLMTGIGMAMRSWDENVWVNLLEMKIDELHNKDIVVSDVRLKNEINMLERKGAKFVWVLRDIPDWFLDGFLSSLEIQESVNKIEKLGIHVTEYSWMFKIPSVDFVYLNLCEGIDGMQIEKMLRTT